MMRYLTILVTLLLMGTMSAHAYESPDISINQISQTPDPVEPGDYVELRFRVDNTGSPASNFVYEIIADYPFSLDPDTPRNVSVGTVDFYQGASGQGAVLYWRLRVDEDAVPGEQNTVRIRYYDRSDPDSVYLTERFTVRIGAQEGLLVLSSSSLDPEAVAPGEPFTLDLEFENLGTAPIRNVRVTADVSDTSFSPFGTANSRLIRSIPAGGSATIAYEFFTAPDAALAVEPVPLNITYVDSTGTAHSLDAMVGVSVDAQPSYLVTLESTEVYTGGSRGEIVVSVSNTGSSPLDYMVLEIAPSDAFDVIGSRSTYLGNLESDDFETGQFDIYLHEDVEEDVPIELQLTYRTAYGEQRVETSAIDLPVYTNERARQLGLVQGGGGSPVLVFIVLLVIAGGLFWWWRRRR